MSYHHVDGPDGPERVHLLEAEELPPKVAGERKADRREVRWIGVIATVIFSIVAIGLIQENTLVAGLVTIGGAVLVLAACRR